MPEIKRIIRAIAFHLPQYHPIPENDDWWGKGFTEWTNTAKALPLFEKHYQPHIPADLGFYDLRLPEARFAQAELARAYGIEGFCYYHYWFAGKRLLEKPVNEILHSGQPDFPFCLCWANETWTGIWHGAPERILIEQTYPGRKDWEEHFNLLFEFFSDPRYLRVEGKPLFVIYKPMQIPDITNGIDLWRELAVKRGLGEIFIIGVSPKYGWNPQKYNMDASLSYRFPSRRPYVSFSNPLKWVKNWIDNKKGKPTIYEYKDIYASMIDPLIGGVTNYPCVVPNWDNTPRSGSNGLVLNNATPELFYDQIRLAKRMICDNDDEHRIIFIKSWNEWAEGNHLEPDIRYGHSYLKVLHEAVVSNK